MQITYFRFLPDVGNLLYTLLLFYHLQGVHAFLIDESADLEYLSLKLCCNQYKSGIGYMCVILRYGLSVFVCVFCFSEGGVRVDYCKIYVPTMSEISRLCPTWNPILITSSILLLSFFRRWDLYRLIVKPKSDAVLGRIQVTRIRGKEVE